MRIFGWAIRWDALEFNWDKKFFFFFYMERYWRETGVFRAQGTPAGGQGDNLVSSLVLSRC